MQSPAGFIQFEQIFIFGRNPGLSLCRSHRAGFLGGGDGIIESSGLGVGGGQDADHRDIFILRQLAGLFSQTHRLVAIAQARV